MRITSRHRQGQQGTLLGGQNRPRHEKPQHEPTRTTQDSPSILGMPTIRVVAAAVSALVGLALTRHVAVPNNVHQLRRGHLYEVVLPLIELEDRDTTRSDNKSGSTFVLNGIKITRPKEEEAPSKLYALFNEEGLNAQKSTLATFIRLAQAVDRELILLPFTSRHYQDEDGVRDLIRMEDYLNNSQPYQWTTVNPFDYNISMVVNDRGRSTKITNHVSNEEFKTALLQKVTGSAALTHPDDCLEGQTVKLVRQKDGGFERVVTTMPYDEMVQKILATDGPVCLKGRVPVNAMDTVFEPSASVLDITSRTFAEWQPRESHGIIPWVIGRKQHRKPLSALHLRRGDKCSEGEDSHSVRCGPAESMPFLDICRQEKDEGGGLYVSTNENDPDFMQRLHESGCILATDLGLDTESIQDEADAINRLRNDNWHSLNAAALQFSVEAHILMTAEKAYSMGGSSTLNNMQRHRQVAGLSPVHLI